MSVSFLSGVFAPVRRFAARRGGVPLLVLFVTVALIALLVATRPRLVPEPHAERVWPVKSVAISRQSLRPQLALFGEIVAGRRSELRARVAGPITQIGRNFREGGLVAAGELLLEIDPFHYRTMLAERRAQLHEAEVRLDQLQREYRRIEALYVDHTVSERDRDNAELSLKQQEAVHYLAHRLRVAGHRDGDVFPTPSARLLFRWSSGTPRLVNILAHKAMLLAYGEGKPRVARAHVALAAGDTEGLSAPGWWRRW